MKETGKEDPERSEEALLGRCPETTLIRGTGDGGQWYSVQARGQKGQGQEEGHYTGHWGIDGHWSPLNGLAGLEAWLSRTEEGTKSQEVEQAMQTRILATRGRWVICRSSREMRMFCHVCRLEETWTCLQEAARDVESQVEVCCFHFLLLSAVFLWGTVFPSLLDPQPAPTLEVVT